MWRIDATTVSRSATPRGATWPRNLLQVRGRVGDRMVRPSEGAHHPGDLPPLCSGADHFAAIIMGDGGHTETVLGEGVMKAAYTEWMLSDAERQKFDHWMATIMEIHSSTKDIRNQQLSWTPLPLSQSVVTLFIT